MVVLFSYGIRTLRLVSFFRSQLRTRFFQALRLMLIHNLWNNLLPMRAGEISFPILMKRYFSIPASDSLPALFWFRLLDLYLVLMLAVISLLLIQDQPLLAVLLMTLLTLAIPLAYLLLPKLLLSLERYAPVKLARILAQCRLALPRSWRLLLLSSFWTLINWTVKLAAFSWIVMQFVEIDEGLALLGAIGGELTTVLPIHGVAGAGTYEAGVVAALLPSGVDKQQALIAAVNLHLFLLSCTLLSGLLSFFIPGRSRPEETGSTHEPR